MWNLILMIVSLVVSIQSAACGNIIGCIITFVVSVINFVYAVEWLQLLLV